MSLRDLTDPQAIRDAIDEWDRLGERDFRSNHHFTHPSGHALLHQGRRYDAKAIAAVAHRNQFGQPLRDTDFNGGPRTGAAQRLIELGFTVESEVATTWDLQPGAVLRRSDLHDRYGGGRQGGMEPSRRTPNIFLFTDSESSNRYGYTFDGWHTDGTFHYTGEGPIGDQVMTFGNKALHQHASDQRAVRLFRGDGSPVVAYLGEFELADEDPVLVDEAPDKDETLRNVFVFRLQPLNTVPASADPSSPLAPGIRLIHLEAANVDQYARQRPDEPAKAVRIESHLVRRYADWLHHQHVDVAVSRHEITTPGGHRLYTDIFNSSTGDLLEAKASASRTHIRAGLGQILDYRRYVDYATCALLVPTRPTDDMLELLHEHGIDCVWETGEAFVRSSNSGSGHHAASRPDAVGGLSRSTALAQRRALPRHERSAAAATDATQVSPDAR